MFIFSRQYKEIASKILNSCQKITTIKLNIRMTLIHKRSATPEVQFKIRKNEKIKRHIK